jgi:hypothetical protein
VTGERREGSNGVALADASNPLLRLDSEKAPGGISDGFARPDRRSHVARTNPYPVALRGDR